jgi:CDP-diacylglycerol--serine O-phosphatidyltransferase
MGTSAPVTAMLALLPMAIDFQIAPNRLPYYISAILIVAIGFLAVSKVPTFSFKGGHIPRKFILPLFLFFLGLLAGLVMFTWFTLTFIGVVYVALIPISIRSAQQEANQK